MENYLRVLVITERAMWNIFWTEDRVSLCDDSNTRICAVNYPSANFSRRVAYHLKMDDLKQAHVPEARKVRL